MIVLHPNAEQYIALNGYRHNSSELLFFKDGSGRYYVDEGILYNPSFTEIHDQLNELERIEYTPFPPEPDDL